MTGNVHRPIEIQCVQVCSILISPSPTAHPASLSPKKLRSKVDLGRSVFVRALNCAGWWWQLQCGIQLRGIHDSAHKTCRKQIWIFAYSDRVSLEKKTKPSAKPLHWWGPSCSAKIWINTRGEGSIFGQSVRLYTSVDQNIWLNLFGIKWAKRNQICERRKLQVRCFQVTKKDRKWQ